jgi:RNA polymerase sigma factor (sigma-70 family)
VRPPPADDVLPTDPAGPGVGLTGATSSGNPSRAAGACAVEVGLAGGCGQTPSVAVQASNPHPTFSSGAPDYLVVQPACEEMEAPPTHASRQERMVVLARRARRGDAYALDELLDLVTDRISSLARRLVKREAFGSALAEEAANSALFAIAQNIRLLQDPERVGGWMIAIVRRRAADVVEAESRSLAALNRPRDDQLELSSGRLSPESQFELRTLLDQARGELPPRRREIVDLCLEQDLKQEDAATTLGCSVGAVKKELHVARAQLKQTLQALEVAPSTSSLARQGKHRASDRT